MQSPIAASRWTARDAVGLRFFFVFFALYILPFPLSELPWLGDAVSRVWFQGAEAVVMWLSAHVFHLAGVVAGESEGSGDSLFLWAGLLSRVVLAVASTLLWSVIDRRSRRYERLEEWLRVALRYRLAYFMCIYGFAKVWKAQFPAMSGMRLAVTYGDSSPMGLLWRFMGYSTAYSFFGGALECLGALLLLFRRTTTLGALLLVTVLTNVVMLNFCFDVPVKILSTLYLLEAAYLASPDGRRLFDVLVLHRAVPARRFEPHFATQRARIAEGIFKVIFIGVAFWPLVSHAHERWRTTGDGSAQPAIAGVYDVTADTKDGEEAPTAGARVSIVRGSFMFMDPDGTRTPLSFSLDLERHLLIGNEGLDPDVLHYDEDGAGGLRLSGSLGGHGRTLTLKRRPEPLLERGFHWVSEKPVNR